MAGAVFHSVAVRGDGSVQSWGWNHFGQLGDATTTARHSPAIARVTSAVVPGAAAFGTLVL